MELPARPDLLSQTQAELTSIMAEEGQPAYRAGQLFAWLHKGARLSAMRNLPRALTDRLAERFEDEPVRVRESLRSADGETVKFLYALSDGESVEGVLMRHRYGYSLCVSTQVGCRMGCRFCASTLGGLVRSLTAGEMIAQVLCANRFLAESSPEPPPMDRVNHVVLMGSGEPMDNLENVTRFLGLLRAENGLNISLRNVSVSTCGLPDGMRALAGAGLPVTLSISLHAPDDEIRREIMPVARAVPMDALLTAARDYVRETGRRVVFEYALIDGVNCEERHARALAGKLRGFQCHVNLIPLNDVPERNLRAAPSDKVRAFLQTLTSLHISATVRRSMGDDVAGACGQLRASRQRGGLPTP